MATGAEWSCPICREPSDIIAYVGSCLHQFCRGCILRWASKNPSCPLCRQTVHTIIYPAPPDQGFVEIAVPPPSPSEPRSSGPPEEPGAAGPHPPPDVEGLPPETWALFFRAHAEILLPLELWLSEVLSGARWWELAFVQGVIVASLCRYGLHEEALARELQQYLQEHTAAFVRRLVQVAADQCGVLARRLGNAAPERSSPGHAAVPRSSAAQEPRAEPQPEQAAASRAGRSGGWGSGGSWQSGRRRGGGHRDARAAYTGLWRRQM